jgi:hypothetical protein
METTILKEDLEKQIIDLIEKDNSNRCDVEFVYAPGNHNGIDLFVITHNPIHKTAFLFSKDWGLTEENALENLIKELHHPNKKKEEFTFTVTWEKVGSTTQNSYFSGTDMYDVLDKFYHGKNPKEYVIFNVKLNPIS